MNAEIQTVVVTGAASGMGRATVDLFLAEGWNVLGLDVVPVDLDSEGSGRFSSHIADVRSRTSVEEALADLLPADGHIDAIANIAGIYPPTSLDSYTEEAYRRIFDINVFGVVNVVAAAKPYMSDGSAVVNFSSVDAFEVSPGQLFYGASKAAVVMLTKALALELAPLGIRVNGIAPGWVATPGNAATGRMEAAAAKIPLGRVALPSEIADWVLLLSTPRYTAFMTGDTVTLSGGAVIRQ
ncbi:3-oxoacyl-[acyl-carrier protein] reductase [Leucobacter exalbidus]|uniref:3-oxoacyl-[acyl-carrier protein] reductase n=1 Tax=Leucobacter exalbidus TaxID=662960 RepID=A0A940PWW2_9MICO|nr:SDR family oxidoreductase [Leucobacter exalbidus]MBP1326829.1 3-oxoacyl-[acyl-carrier protein] reductase [Leucobacter exalbidus]